MNGLKHQISGMATNFRKRKGLQRVQNLYFRCIMMHIEHVNSGPTTQVLTNCGSTGMMEAARKNFCLYIFTERGDSFRDRLGICTKGLDGQVAKIDF